MASYPTLVDTATGDSGGQTATWEALLPEFATGDLVFIMTYGDISDDGIIYIDGAEGFTEIDQAHVNSNLTILLGYRVIDGSEGWVGDGTDTITIKKVGSNYGGASLTATWRNCEFVDYISNGDPSSIGTEHDPPNLDLGSSEPIMWLAAWSAVTNGNSVVTYPTNFTQDQYQHAFDWSGRGGFSRYDYEASSINPSTYVLSDEDDMTWGATLAFRYSGEQGGGWGAIGL